MAAKEYLMQISNSEKTIRAKLEQKAKLKDLSKKITSNTSNAAISHGGVSDKVGECATNIVQLEREIDEAVDNLVDLMREVMATIEKVDASNYRLLLELYYINGKTFDEIAIQMDYCTFHVRHRLHHYALNKVDDILKDALECTVASVI